LRSLHVGWHFGLWVGTSLTEQPQEYKVVVPSVGCGVVLPGAGLLGSYMPVGFLLTSVVDIPGGGVGYVVSTGGGVG